MKILTLETWVGIAAFRIPIIKITWEVFWKLTGTALERKTLHHSLFIQCYLSKVHVLFRKDAHLSCVSVSNGDITSAKKIFGRSLQIIITSRLPNRATL